MVYNKKIERTREYISLSATAKKFKRLENRTRYPRNTLKRIYTKTKRFFKSLYIVGELTYRMVKVELRYRKLKGIS